MQQKTRAASLYRIPFLGLVAFLIAVISFFIVGCNKEQEAESFETELLNTIEPNEQMNTIAITSTPMVRVTQTPTMRPTPIPTPTPVPLTVEEKVAKMFVYDPKNVNNFFPLNQMLFLHFKIGEDERIALFFCGVHTDKKDGIEKAFMRNVTDDSDLIYYPTDIFSNYGPNGVDYFTTALPYAEGYKDKTLQIIFVGSMFEFESYLRSIGIDFSETKYSSKINDISARGGYSSGEFAKYLALVLPDRYCVFHEDTIGQ